MTLIGTLVRAFAVRTPLLLLGLARLSAAGLLGACAFPLSCLGWTAFTGSTGLAPRIPVAAWTLLLPIAARFAALTAKLAAFAAGFSTFTGRFTAAFAGFAGFAMITLVRTRRPLVWAIQALHRTCCRLI